MEASNYYAQHDRRKVICLGWVAQASAEHKDDQSALGAIKSGDALVESVRSKNKDLMNLLLLQGADINHVENNSHGTACVEDTALSLAVEQNDGPLVEFLITKGANPNLPEGELCGPPLLRAQPDRHMVEYLLSKRSRY